MSDAHDDRETSGEPGSEPTPPDETTRLPADRPDEEPSDQARLGDEPTTRLPGGGYGDEPTAVLGGGDQPTSALPPYGAVPPDDDRTRAMPPAGGPDDERTSALPPVGGPDDERTSVLPPYGGPPMPPPPPPYGGPPADPYGAAPDDRTSVMPPQDVWTGRAGVPSRESGPVRGATPPPPGIEYTEGERTWRAPLIIAGIALLLLVLFGVGAWFALRGSGPAPEPSASPTPELTTAAPTSAAPSPSPTPSPVASRVAVPGDLIGMTEQEAIDALSALGLNPQIELRQSDEADPGTVIDAEPEPGTELEQGETVVIVIAVAPPSPSPEPEPSPSPEEPSPSPSE
ncbi:PASTA domain-containing protein [Catellatospora sp. NPDC049609]|uniref:PASTA domain-containing protein n=1 Tax=Catellatospora sp. NPDC049609 TaxID=3155505 RepID=UPI0034205E88